MRHLALLAILSACGGDDGGDCSDRSSADPGYMHKDGQGTYAGQSCIESGCHLAGHLGAQAPEFSVGGTVFKPDGTTPQAGVIVEFKPLTGSGAAITTKTDQAGNFFLDATKSPFPAVPHVSACPSSAEMLEGALDPSYGSCATQSCHSRGQGRGPIILED
jgi:hypothetical protein